MGVSHMPSRPLEDKLSLELKFDNNRSNDSTVLIAALSHVPTISVTVTPLSRQVFGLSACLRRDTSILGIQTIVLVPVYWVSLDSN
jgi:hypothetical protein